MQLNLLCLSIPYHDGRANQDLVPSTLYPATGTSRVAVRSTSNVYSSQLHYPGCSPVRDAVSAGDSRGCDYCVSKE